MIHQRVTITFVLLADALVARHFIIMEQVMQRAQPHMAQRMAHAAWLLNRMDVRMMDIIHAVNLDALLAKQMYRMVMLHVLLLLDGIRGTAVDKTYN